MALPPDEQKRLDHFAALARPEFEANWKHWNARDVAIWWSKWCRYGKTNHDRLGRILLEATGVKDEMTVSADVSDLFPDEE